MPIVAIAAIVIVVLMILSVLVCWLLLRDQRIRLERQLDQTYRTIKDRDEEIENHTSTILDLERRIEDQGDQIRAQAETARSREKQAVVRSRIVHVAKISEQFAPLLPEFPNFNMKDVQWVGGTVDMIVWDGLEEDRDVTVVLVDIKTGNAVTSQRQRKIKDAVEAGRVRFEVVRIPATRELTGE